MFHKGKKGRAAPPPTAGRGTGRRCQGRPRSSPITTPSTPSWLRVVEDRQGVAICEPRIDPRKYGGASIGRKCIERRGVDHVAATVLKKPRLQIELTQRAAGVIPEAAHAECFRES